MPKFEKGRSGNPKGRPPKPRTGPDALRAQLLAECPAILAGLVEKAKEGDPTAAKLVLARCLPALKPRDEAAPLPAGIDLSSAPGAVLAALVAGDLSPDQASAVAGVLATLVRVRESVELEQRIAALEESREQFATSR